MQDTDLVGLALTIAPGEALSSEHNRPNGPPDAPRLERRAQPNTWIPLATAAAPGSRGALREAC